MTDPKILDPGQAQRLAALLAIAAVTPDPETLQRHTDYVVTGQRTVGQPAPEAMPLGPVTQSTPIADIAALATAQTVETPRPRPALPLARPYVRQEG